MSSKPVYRASGIYQCPRHLSAIRLGVVGDPEPAYLLMAAEEGTEQEHIIKRKLRAEGIEIIDGATVNGTDENGNEKPCPVCLKEFGDERFGLHTEISSDSLPFRVVGHKDGEALEAIFKRLLEVKTMSGFEFPRWEREGWDGFPEYANQVTVYWSADGYDEALYVIKNRSSGFTKKQYLSKPPRDIKDILSHITAVENWVTEHGTVMDAVYNPQSIECKRCLYARVLECVAEVTLQQPDKEALTLGEKDWLKGDKMEKEGKALKESAKERFTAHAISEGLKGRTWRFGGLDILHYHVSRKGYAVKPTEFDTTKITRAKENDD